jgi:Protein kinase domain/Calx-beta domain
MSVPAELNEASVGEADDALRALLSSMLSGRYKEELYLRHVSELCRDDPESAPKLLGLIDRYYRLGRMPAEQFQKVKARIEQAMGTRPAADPVETQSAYEGDTDSEESVTRELTPARAQSPPQIGGVRSGAMAEPPRAAPTTAPPSRPAAPSEAVPPPQSAAADATHLSIGIGTVLRDRYELLQQLGRGGMASVYKARDRYRTSLGVADCYVAVKIVQPHPSRPGSVDALGREFHNAQRLSHPNVVNVYDIDHEGDASFYSMEFLEGERLSQLLNRAGGPLPRRYALAIIRDIGAAIAHAHSRGVVHADLKPHNIMIIRDGHVRVLDFGSGVVRPGEPWIAELSPGGQYRQATPAYASCEQLQGWCADPRDDIYALACLAYQLLAGKHPFDQRSSLVARGRRMRPRRPAGMRGDNWRALRRGLAWSREQRNMTVEKWLEQIGISEAAPTLPPLVRLAAAPPPRQWPQWVAVAAVVLFSLGLAAFAMQRQTGVDWRQALAQVQNTWDRAWLQLQPSANSSALVAPAANDPVVAPLTPMPLAAAAAPVNPIKPAAPAPSHASSARVAGTSGVPAAIASADDALAPAAAAGSPRIAFAASSYQVAGSEPAARIVVRRRGNTDGDVSFTWWTEGASAQPDVDYASLGRRVETIASGTDKITVYVPIISNPQRSGTSQFYVALRDSDSARSGAPSARATVTIDRGE